MHNELRRIRDCTNFAQFSHVPPVIQIRRLRKANEIIRSKVGVRRHNLCNSRISPQQ